MIGRTISHYEITEKPATRGAMAEPLLDRPRACSEKPLKEQARKEEIMQRSIMQRRDFLKSAAGAGYLASAMAQGQQTSPAAPPATRTAKLKQAVVNVVFGGGAYAPRSAEEAEKNCKLAASIGFQGYDFADPAYWPILKNYGLVPAMIYAAPQNTGGGGGRAAAAGAAGAPGRAQGAAAAPGAQGAQGAQAASGAQGAQGAAPAGGAARGGAGGRGPARPPQASAMNLNNPALHDEQEKLLHAAIDQAAAGGVPGIIVFSGAIVSSDGMTPEVAADNCFAILNRVKAHAEDKGIDLSMEYLSNNGEYLGPVGHLAWGTDLMKRVNSPHVGILLDLWHLQVTEGDIVRHIRQNIQWINHIHTAGEPGRNQLDDNQDLNYHFIARAIADLNFQKFVAHEYSPTKDADPAACLKQAFDIFNI
jgi:hydroxypyruvate isomerase